MRVVAGELGGRRLQSPPRRSAAVRPTADRVREALFSILGDVEGTAVLDLYCGTGALGIEAVSRGAAGAVLVDTHTALAYRNVSELGNVQGSVAIEQRDHLAARLGEHCDIVREHRDPEPWQAVLPRSEDLPLAPQRQVDLRELEAVAL